MKALALALAVLVIPVAAQAATKHTRQHVSKQNRSGHAYQPQIACTPVGCLPVPRGCHRAGGKTFDGDPSGFDVMACPDWDIYGHQ